MMSECKHSFVDGQQDGERGRFCLYCSQSEVEWTTTPPTVPGWYFHRHEPWERYQALEVELNPNTGLLRLVGINENEPEDYGGEWWPERIKEPE
jgi:hypothetical protein